MQPGSAPPPQPSHSWWIVGPIVAVVIMAFSALLFFQTRDPMMIIFGFIAAVLTTSFFRPWRWHGYRYGYPGWWGAPAPPVQVVKVKCASCGALNDEHARYCSHCGKPM